MKLIWKRTRGNKYNAQKTPTIDGKMADSKAEAAYYNQLYRQGVKFTYHQKFTIVPEFTRNNRHYSKRVYTPDFCLYENSKLVKVVDVKGAKITADAKMRMVLFAERYQLPVIIARYDYRTGLFTED